MAEPVRPAKAKLFIGILFSSEETLYRVEKKLRKKYGEIDHRTDYIPFSHTEYYSRINSNLFKVIFSFNKLVKREEIVKIKLYTNSLEKKMSENSKRSVNIDPGYLTLSNVFLASCKDYFHRVYLGRGVYLENEYKYVAKKFEPWDWTYPDYKKAQYINFFHEVRRIYHKQMLKKGGL